MKKALTNTRVTVKIRKSDFRDEWYLYLEAYPIYTPGKKTPSRVREYVNRTITTPIWDKSRTARTTEKSTTYKPKRDANGIIQCKSPVDQEACIYADNIRSIRQREYDNTSLYTDVGKNIAEQNEKSQCNFIEYFHHIAKERHKNSSKSIIINWNRVYELLKIFAKSDSILFSQIDVRLMEEFKMFLLTAPQGGKKKGTLSQNSASTYFAIFKAGLKQAFVDGYLTIDLSAKVRGIKEQESRREYLTRDELQLLADTPCDKPIMKRAALFSALTGLRHSDIQKLKWSEVQEDGNHYRLHFTQQKTKGVEYKPISKLAYLTCGERKEPDRFVFEDLPDPSWISRPLERWIKAAGITRKITFHSFRHTFATLLIAEGTDIYIVKEMMGHNNVQTTQIYAKVINEKKDLAADAIQIDLNLENL